MTAWFVLTDIPGWLGVTAAVITVFALGQFALERCRKGKR